ncbi:hypothetical protein MSHI_32440 [Mycobacterium shinjukuense]|uniref:DUF222 domain-containing protein n=1 Tax=Mycobacterium shinjukuense TaxID=398694 RepID=A0A7I7MSU5_9MYCO|nr:hypothetical protein MSHI_32440 [Mycobacterium shinjukuense]
MGSTPGCALLVCGKLGQHNGLPASIIVTTTLAEAEAAAGTALTGGGSLLPMSDVIRLARHARHHLAVFDHGKALALYHSKRLASPAQRIVLYANERGCSAPGCTVGGYYCEVHHLSAPKPSSIKSTARREISGELTDHPCRTFRSDTGGT